MPDPLAIVLRSLLVDRSTAALATLHDGRLAASMIPFAVHTGPAGLRLVTHVSGLAAHTREMRSCPDVCLLIMAADAPGTMPQALARVSIPARAEFIPADHPDHTALTAAYLQKFPEAASFFSLGDFSIVAFRPEVARLVAGFARAVTLPPDALAEAVAETA
ncbi:MAG: pyridoxamine 5'-phosphate oxidase family protein [Planctomycetota bacterium]